MYICIKFLLFYVENFVQLYTSTYILKAPTIERFYVKNSHLYIKWSEDEIEITEYNIVLYSDDCTNNTVDMVDGNTLETTIPVENLTNRDNFYLQIQACSKSLCSRNGTALHISDIEDPGKHINTFFCIIDLFFSTALQLPTITKNVNNSFVCFNTSILDKCETFGTVKINNISYVLNSNYRYVNKTSYFAFPFDNNWMEYRLSKITDKCELCITNISKFLSEFMSVRKFIINDQCSKSKKPCSAINTSLNYLEIGFQRILDIKGEHSL